MYTAFIPFSVVFCGTSAFAVPALRALTQAKDFAIDHVITQPDKPAGRGKKLTASPVKNAALELGLNVLQPEKMNSNLQSPISNLQSPDFLIVVAYGQILSQEALDWPAVAPINLHASLLPRWRGASPIQHAILGSDSETGVTVQKMVRELDAGPILSQQKIAIGPRETAAALHDLLATIGAKLLVETLRHPLKEKEQDESLVTVCHKLLKSDGLVDPREVTAEEIDRRVRALTPWPGVTCDLTAVLPHTRRSDPVKILSTSLGTAAYGIPLPCANGTTLTILKLQPPGKGILDADAWLRGVQLR